MHCILPILSERDGSTSLIPAFNMEPAMTEPTARAALMPLSVCSVCDNGDVR